jgi:hypothetical protein
VALPTDPWIHDLRTTSSFTELWPWLLVLALLLWPLDVALRRVSLGRRELIDARAWVGRTIRARRRAAPRTVAAEGMLAARERAAGGAARAALLRGPAGKQAPGASAAGISAAGATAAGAPAAGGTTPGARAEGGEPSPARAASAPAAEVTPKPSPPAAPAPRSEPIPEETDTLARLREAKRRARGG